RVSPIVPARSTTYDERNFRRLRASGVEVADATNDPEVVRVRVQGQAAEHGSRDGRSTIVNLNGHGVGGVVVVEEIAGPIQAHAAIPERQPTPPRGGVETRRTG